MDRVQGYDEDQIALVISDLSSFAAQVPLILGTPTISHVIIMHDKVEGDRCLGDTLGKCRSGLIYLAVQWAIATMENMIRLQQGNLTLVIMTKMVTTKDTETIDMPSNPMLYM